MSTISSAPMRLSADVGGTFTDVAAFNETTGELSLGKTLTTPQKLVTGIEESEFDQLLVLLERLYVNLDGDED